MSDSMEIGGGPEAGLLAGTVAALQASGRMVQTDWIAGNFEVLPLVEGTEATVGIIRESAQSVIFYQVWPETVREEQLPAMVEFVVRANVDLIISCFELNPDSGILAVRGGLSLAGLQIVDEPWSADVCQLLINALDNVEKVADRYSAAVSALAGGESDAIGALALVVS